METISFPDLLSMLPRGDEFRARKFLPGLSYVQSSNTSFVEPDLRIEYPAEHGKTSVILLAAPGAVGKSTFAAELAHRTGALYWDLSKFQVGSQTFSGSILHAYDFEATGVLKRFQNGDFLFVLDALDEAQVRAGTQNFDAFLADLVTALEKPRVKPVMVLLARSDTADWIDLVLQEAHVPLARYQIEFFDHGRATEFLAKRLDERRSRDGGQPLHRLQTAAYASARSVLFEMIYDLFKVSPASAWQDNRVHHFLGYAPVLEALADYLDVSNYFSFVNEIRTEATEARDPWQFLADILSRLMAREQRKVAALLQPKLEAAARNIGWSDWDRLYTPQEQRSRVLAHHLRVVVESPALPPPISTGYEEGLKTILPQHPFLAGRDFANVVFKEFSYAWGLTQGERKLAEALREAMRQRETPFLPSQLFSRFVVSLAKDTTPILDAQDFGVLYESLISRAEHIPLTILQADGFLDVSATIEGENETVIEVNLLDTGSGIHFWRRLSNADIDVTANIRLGLPENRFLLGAGVHIDCGMLIVACDIIDVDLAEGVTIRAGSYSALSPSLKLYTRNEDKGTLAVSWPAVGYPWASYKAAEGPRLASLDDSVRGDTLRKFILMFRRQRTRKADTLRGARWAPAQLAERDRLIDLAFRLGVLRAVPGRDLIEFNNDFGSLSTLVEGRSDLSQRAAEFVAAYLGT
jgi:hypothetical protein